MIWIFLSLAAVAIVFITLGALSVWVAVLSMALQALLAATVLFVLYLGWKRFYGRQK